MTERIPFTVDSALLQELGERLVGAPHIALAELIKNAYDADATRVQIRFTPDRIDIVDNGHGMSRDDFIRYWMRVGSTHKDERGVSPKFGRPLTGSKGVGRLAVQFLARHLSMTTHRDDSDEALEAQVDWSEAVQAGELTEATAMIKRVAHAGQGGTAISLRGLNQIWTPARFEELAREIWPLQPPFRLTDAQRDATGSFEVELESDDPELARRFREQMEAILSLWQARLVGSLVREGDGAQQVHLTLEFDDRTRSRVAYQLPVDHLHAVDFEIRVFDLRHRQPFGIRVDEARQYLKEFGGVHVYDAGFHLPYYGADTDWLRIEIDHSHRLSRSRLLPENLQVAEGLNNLPTNSRLYGVVHVNTAIERRIARESGLPTAEVLGIQTSRDRLQDNQAYRQLVDVVRWSLDYYAMQATRRAFSVASREVARTAAEGVRVLDVVQTHEREIPVSVRNEIRRAVREDEAAAEAARARIRAEASLLAALATAGISTLAYEHEARKQLDALRQWARALRDPSAHTATGLAAIADQMDAWLERAASTRRLFAHLLDESPRAERKRHLARSLIEDVAADSEFLLRPVSVDATGVAQALRVPAGTYAEWAALLQNLFTNAANAIVAAGASDREIHVSSRRQGPRWYLLVQDAGVGVNLDDAEGLFEPFVRRARLPPARAALGLGGSGLGLTIVRMLAENIGVRVQFVPPVDPYSTAVELSWVDR